MPTLGTKRMMDRMSYQNNKRARLNREIARRYPKPEAKFVTKSVAHSSTTESSTFINSVANGPDNGERVGRKTKTLYCEATLLGTSAAYRVILYLSKNGSTTLSLTNLSDLVDPEKFVVFKDYWVTNQGNGAATKMKHSFKYGINTEYDGVNNSDIEDGQLVLYIRSNTDTIAGQTRAWYVDN